MDDPRYPIGPFQYDGKATPQLRGQRIGEIAAAPGALRAAVAGLTSKQLDTPYREQGWTVRQVVHHLPDSHLNAYTRIKLALTEDEDAAESVRAPDESIALIHAEGAPGVQASGQPAVPAVSETRRDKALAAAQAKLVKTAVNAPRPQMRPSLRDDVMDPDVAPTSPGRNWTIQIGAYADKALALAQLKTYAGMAQDILSKASQIVAPLQSNNGHVIYRARFGLFAEQEARDVCNRLTQRGQICFAAAQTR